MSDWLELELAHRLTPVEAPEELWERVQNAQRAPASASWREQRRGVWAWPAQRFANGTWPAQRRSVWAWPAAAMAAVTLAVAAWCVASLCDPVLDIRQLAAAQTGRAAPLQIQTSDPRAIRLWLRQNTGLDVPLPPATSVRLEGARWLGHGSQRVAAVEYRVGGNAVTLLVARADPHRPLPSHGARVAAWQAHDQVYALASPNSDQVDAACQLCHASL